MRHPDGPHTGRPPTYAPRGMVATPHVLASAAGLEALQRGGSAVDAAIAANAVLSVVYPHMAGLGGDGFWLIAGPTIHGVEALNASDPAAAGATVTRIVDFGYDVQQAIEAPRWLMGPTWGTESRNLSLASRSSDEVTRELALRGQPVREAWSPTIGHAQAIRINRADSFLEGGADPRGDGAALGY